MDKAGLMWVLIRAFGLVCVWKALEMLPSVLVAAQTVWELPEQSLLIKENAMEQAARSFAIHGFWLLGIQFAIYAGLAAYCLFRGNTLHRIFMRSSRPMSPNAVVSSRR